MPSNATAWKIAHEKRRDWSDADSATVLVNMKGVENVLTEASSEATSYKIGSYAYATKPRGGYTFDVSRDSQSIESSSEDYSDAILRLAIKRSKDQVVTPTLPKLWNSTARRAAFFGLIKAASPLVLTGAASTWHGKFVRLGKPLEFATGQSESSNAPILNPKLREGLQLRARALKRLEKNWDGYGALPLKPAAIDDIAQDLEQALIGLDLPPPDIIPGGDGSIQAEWRRKGYNLFYNREPDGSKQLFVEHVRRGERWEYGGPEARSMLGSWAILISD